jgi:hypothetical protein
VAAGRQQGFLGEHEEAFGVAPSKIGVVEMHCGGRETMRGKCDGVRWRSRSAVARADGQQLRRLTVGSGSGVLLRRG